MKDWKWREGYNFLAEVTSLVTLLDTYRDSATILPSARAHTGWNGFDKIQDCYPHGHHRVNVYELYPNQVLVGMQVLV